ncbi:MAG: hypothetical protein WD847_18960 [Pirellulales bacterium]
MHPPHAVRSPGSRHTPYAVSPSTPYAVSPFSSRHTPYAVSPLASSPPRPLLLLEGSWPAAPTDGACWSLDDSIDHRIDSIDAAAVDLATRAAGPASPLFGPVAALADLHSLSLRYYLARLLRVIAFFDHVHAPAVGEAIDLYLASRGDEDYHDLFTELARRHGWRLTVYWHESSAPLPRRARRPSRWRRWAAAAADRLTPRVPPPACPAVSSADQAPRVILCGSPRVLDPICAELVARGCQIWWLYEQFAVRCWWRWRRAGVRQLTLAPSPIAALPSDEALPRGLLTYHQIDLTSSIARFLHRRPGWLGQSVSVPQSSSVSPRVPPVPCCKSASGGSPCPLVDSSSLLILDEDCTPLKRAAIAFARSHGIKSVVVQHGAPCVRFGFAPLHADVFYAWGESSRRQLEAWQVPSERIVVTGAPGKGEGGEGDKATRRQGDKATKTKVPSTKIQEPSPKIQLATSNQQPATSQILLLATVPPSDHRPDSVAFHLTRRTHRRMIEIAFAAVARLPRARLIVKLHPRSVDDSDFRAVMARFPALDVRLVRHADCRTLVHDADCVLSCASTAGIEAAWSGAPVIQLLPLGSADILPAHRWGLLGTAREQAELDVLLARALSGAAAPVRPREPIFAATGPTAARLIVDHLLSNRPETVGWLGQKSRRAGMPQSSSVHDPLAPASSLQPHVVSERELVL